jgi:hypothetical protein
MSVFLVVVPCSLVEVYKHLGVLAASINRVIIILMMEAGSNCEASVNFYQAPQHYNPENSHLY